MELEELIQNLVQEPKTKRIFDDAIAEQMGWTRAYESRRDDTTGEVRNVQIKKWHPPGSETLQRVPSFTTDLQVSLDLAAELSPGRTIGVSWGSDELAHAVIGEGPTLRGATPAMALCAAAMLCLRSKAKASRTKHTIGSD